MIILIGLCFLFLVLVFVISAGCTSILSRNINPPLSWSSPYECGFVANSASFDSFSFSYFSLLVFFVVFDLEISLLLNMPEQGAIWGGFVFYIGFLLILSFGFLTEVVFGYVRWGY
uniref:NADH-ubiquinone oxidoreductase chain 3 n=1 Tax=Caryophyllaeides fennica TaxID=507535 RepID=H9YU14_9CEST|nr:NADH dehydrogenase subunit 3 [Caryophyllaeides fennica]